MALDKVEAKLRQPDYEVHLEQTFTHILLTRTLKCIQGPTDLVLSGGLTFSFKLAF